MRRFGTVIGSVTAGCLLAGCSALPSLPGLGKAAEPKAAPTSATTSPGAGRSVSDEEGRTIIAEYIKRNNAANRARSEKLLAGFEGGSSFAIDKAAYTSSRLLTKQADYTYKPFAYTKPTYYAPPAGGASWFLTTAHWQRGKETAKEVTYLLFAREAAGWRQVYSPDSYEDTADKLPSLKTDGAGAAAEVAQADGKGLLMAPGDFARRYAAHLSGKGTAADKTLFAADDISTGAASNRAKMARYAKLTEVVRPATGYPSYALRTADGGALTFTTLQRDRRYDVRQGPERNYVFQKDSGLLRGHYYNSMKMTELIQVAAHIPPKDGKPAQVQVVAGYSGLTAGSGR
ncbi:hypothetical protein [Nonomuraea sp. NPDC049141]|uniref:hypothetical protein n=1 Tax=Nonomuraea sp. NPDC049141 TaxID=3155500 RepID=UPI0033F06AFC